MNGQSILNKKSTKKLSYFECDYEDNQIIISLIKCIKEYLEIEEIQELSKIPTLTYL